MDARINTRPPVTSFAVRFGLPTLLCLSSLREYWRVFPCCPEAALALHACAVTVTCNYLYLNVGFGSTRLGRAVSRYGFTILTLTLAICVLALYPIADARKLSGLGSDQDDAVRDCMTRLFMGKYPYGLPTYLGNPASPGPGTLLLHLPSYLLGWFPATFCILHFLWMRLVQSKGTSMSASSALLALAPGYLALVATGSDLPQIGLALSMCIHLVLRPASPRNQVALFCLLSLVGSSRVVFPVIPAALTLASLRFFPHRLVVCALGLLASISIQGIFYFLSPTQYSPAHLLAKGSGVLPNFAALALSCAVVPLLFRGWYSTNPVSGLLLVLAAALGAPMLFTAGGAFFYHADCSPALWEGQNYIAWLLPATISGFTLVLGNGEPSCIQSRHLRPF